VAAARDNAIANGVEIEVRRFDLRAQPLPSMDVEGAHAAEQVVLANLLGPLLLELARTMSHCPAHLLAGGLLREQSDEVVGAFADRQGLVERQRRESGEWAAVWLAAP
jgi:ribosomal protein L11 methylase PrmA